MLNKLLIPAFLSAALLPSFAAQAEDSKSDDGDARYDPTYSALRLTSAQADFDNLDRAVNLGFTLGINIPALSFLAAEIDLSTTLIPGENRGTGSITGGGGGGGGGGFPIDPLDPLGGGGGEEGDGGSASPANNTSDPDDLRLSTVGIFAVGRTPGRYFGSARLGYRFVESSINELNENQSGSAWGLGMGYRYGEAGGAVELTYSQYGSDLSYLSLAISY